MQPMATRTSNTLQFPLVQDQRKHSVWTKEENQIYVQFLKDNLAELQNGKSRRTKFFFKRMADQMKNTRDNQQCRSHHQKMMKHYSSVDKIISHFSRKEQTKPPFRHALKTIENRQQQEEIHGQLITDQNKSFLLKKLSIQHISFNMNEKDMPRFQSSCESPIKKNQISPYAFMNESLKTPKFDF